MHGALQRPPDEWCKCTDTHIHISHTQGTLEAPDQWCISDNEGDWKQEHGEHMEPHMFPMTLRMPLLLSFS